MTQGSLTVGGIETMGLSATTRLLQSFDFGSPATETESVARLLYDGEVVTGDRSGNRKIELPLRIEGATSLARAALVAALQTATDGPFTITWTPGDGLPVVFDCFRATLSLEYDSLRALQGSQHLTLTCEAAPFTRTPDLATISPAATAPITIDAFDATTGITATAAGSGAGAVTTTLVTTPRIQGTGAVKLAFNLGAGSNGGYYWQIAKTVASTNLSTAATVRLYAKTSQYMDTVTFADLTLSSAGGSKTWRITSPIGNGYSMLSWNLSATPTASTGTLSLAAVTGYVVKVQHYNPTLFASSQPVFVYVDDFAGALAGSSSNMTGASGWVVFSGIQGGARTPLSLAIDAGSAINNLVLSRSPNPPPTFTPVLSTPFSGAGTADATAISGFRYITPVYHLPVQSVSGTYVLVARVKLGSASGTLIATTNTTSDSNYSASVTANVSGSTSAFALYTIGELTLPPREPDALNTAATIDIAITGTAIGTAACVDQLYLIDLAGESLIVDLPSALSYRYWWIDAPMVGEFRSRIYAGTASDRSDAVAVTPWVKGPASFNFSPGSNFLTVVCDKSTGTPAVTASYYPLNLYERAA